MNNRPRYDSISGEDYLEVLFDRSEQRLMQIGHLQAEIDRLKKQVADLETDKEILDWMEREGLESIVRVPQFDRDGNSLGVNLWVSHWLPKQTFATMRECAIAGMSESKK